MIVKTYKIQLFFFRDHETQSLKAELVQPPGRLTTQLSIASNENKTKNKIQVIHEAGSLSLIAYNHKHMNFRIFRKSSTLQNVQQFMSYSTQLVFDWWLFCYLHDYANPGKQGTSFRMETFLPWSERASSS